MSLERSTPIGTVKHLQIADGRRQKAAAPLCEYDCDPIDRLRRFLENARCEHHGLAEARTGRRHQEVAIEVTPSWFHAATILRNRKLSARDTRRDSAWPGMPGKLLDLDRARGPSTQPARACASLNSRWLTWANFSTWGLRVRADIS